MKKKDLILLISIALYSGLFYEQLAGINFLIFTIAIIILSVINKKELQENRSWQAAAVGAFVSAICIAWHGNLLSFIGNVVSLALLSRLAVDKRTSVAAAILVSLINSLTSWYLIFSEKFFPKRDENEPVSLPSKKNISTRLLIYGIPVFVFLVFFLLYRASNPVFDYYAGLINLDFISFGWVMFTLSGWLGMYAFFYFKKMKGVNDYDINAAGYISENRINPNSKLNRTLSAENENTSGIVLFVALNGLLFFLNIIDVNFTLLAHFTGQKLPHGITHSQMVHQGIDALIWSIILAFSVILYHFRGRLNFFAKNKTIKMLAVLWIGQNVFMVFSTAVRNYFYISADGITAKRIGVYFYLGLCIIGLIYTFVKILNKNTNWQLVRQVSRVFYIVLILSCMINWEAYITDYNVNWQERKLKNVDGGYLISLDAYNLPKLVDLRNQNIKSDSLNEKWQRIDSEIYQFLRVQNHMDWRSWCLDNHKVSQNLEILASNQKFNSFFLDNFGAGRGSFLEDLSPLSGLNIKNLYLDHVNIFSIRNVESLAHLQQISFANGRVSNFYGIEQLKNLNTLRFNNVMVDQQSRQGTYSVKTIYVKNIGYADSTAVRNIFPDAQILKY